MPILNILRELLVSCCRCYVTGSWWVWLYRSSVWSVWRPPVKALRLNISSTSWHSSFTRPRRRSWIPEQLGPSSMIFTVSSRRSVTKNFVRLNLTWHYRNELVTNSCIRRSWEGHLQFCDTFSKLRRTWRWAICRSLSNGTRLWSNVARQYTLHKKPVCPAPRFRVSA